MFSSKSFVDIYDWASVYKPRLDSGRKNNIVSEKKTTQMTFTWHCEAAAAPATIKNN